MHQEHDLEAPLPSTPNLALVVPLYPKRAYTRRGSGLQRVSLYAWTKEFDPGALRRILRARMVQQGLSDSERQLVELLIETGERGSTAPVTITVLAKVRGKSVATTRRLVDRMGRAGLLVNRGTVQAFDLAIAPLEYWDLSQLQSLRKDRRVRIAEWERGRERGRSE